MPDKTQWTVLFLISDSNKFYSYMKQNHPGWVSPPPILQWVEMTVRYVVELTSEEALALQLSVPVTVTKFN